MRPTTSEEFRRLSRVFGATCTKGSAMFGVARTLTGLTDEEPIPLFAASLPAINALIPAAGRHGGILTLEILCEHFASPIHYLQIRREGTTVGNEIELHPVELRPVLHTLLPLNKEGVYENAGVKIELLGLIEFQKGDGKGFWAAHLAGKIWIPRAESFRQQLLEEQALSKEFVKALHVVANQHGVVDFYEYRRLLRQTHEAKEEIEAKSR